MLDPLDQSLDPRIVPPIFDSLGRVRDSRSVTAEHLSDVMLRPA
jgi:hypothetical protein